MACGLPVIVTGGGATDDFATDEFAYRIAAVRKTIENQVGDLKLVKRGWLLEPDLTTLSSACGGFWLIGMRREPKAWPPVSMSGETGPGERAAQTASQRLHNPVRPPACGG